MHRVESMTVLSQTKERTWERAVEGMLATCTLPTATSGDQDLSFPPVYPITPTTNSPKYSEENYLLALRGKEEVMKERSYERIFFPSQIYRIKWKWMKVNFTKHHFQWVLQNIALKFY